MSTPYLEAIAASFADELEKIAQEKIALPSKKTLAVGATSIAGYETLRRANQDRKMGRAVRQQQGGY